MSGADRVDMPQALASVAEREAAEVNTCRAAKVIRLIDGGKSVAVELLVGDWVHIGAGKVEARTVDPLEPIPVGYQSSGDGDVVLVIKPKIGSIGLVHFRDVSHSEADSGQDTNGRAPARKDRWALDNAIFVPMIGTGAGVVAAADLRDDGAPVLGMAAGLAFHVGGGAASIPVPRNPAVQANFTNIKKDLDALWGSVFGGTATYTVTATDSERLMVDG